MTNEIGVPMERLLKMKVCPTTPFLSRVHDIINSHLQQTGKRPMVIEVPMPELLIDDVRVHFNNSPNWISCDAKNAVHHHFKEHS